jgi:hypothetical protein
MKTKDEIIAKQDEIIEHLQNRSSLIESSWIKKELDLYNELASLREKDKGKQKTYSWFCPHCQRFLIPQEVTFEETSEETHTSCGYSVKWKMKVEGEPELTDELIIECLKELQAQLDHAGIGWSKNKIDKYLKSRKS